MPKLLDLSRDPLHRRRCQNYWAYNATWGKDGARIIGLIAGPRRRRRYWAYARPGVPTGARIAGLVDDVEIRRYQNYWAYNGSAPMPKVLGLPRYGVNVDAKVLGLSRGPRLRRRCQNYWGSVGSLGCCRRLTGLT